MPFPVTRLDTQVPPLWESYWGRVNPMAADPWLDPQTALEETNEDDYVNMLTEQRVQGDLFARDLYLQLGLLGARRWLMTRGSLTLSVPQVRLRANDFLTLGVLMPTSGVDYWVSTGLHVEGTGVVAQIFNRSSNSVTYQASGPVWHALDLEAPAIALDGSSVYEVRLRNNSGSAQVGVGWALFTPVTINPGVSNESSSSSGSSSSDSSSSDSSSSST